MDKNFNFFSGEFSNIKELREALKNSGMPEDVQLQIIEQFSQYLNPDGTFNFEEMEASSNDGYIEMGVEGELVEVDIDELDDEDTLIVDQNILDDLIEEQHILKDYYETGFGRSFYGFLLYLGNDAFNNFYSYVDEDKVLGAYVIVMCALTGKDEIKMSEYRKRVEIMRAKMNTIKQVKDGELSYKTAEEDKDWVFTKK